MHFVHDKSTVVEAKQMHVRNRHLGEYVLFALFLYLKERQSPFVLCVRHSVEYLIHFFFFWSNLILE